jgi:hypothetical protein
MASKHHGATQDYWSFVIAVVTEVTGVEGSGVRSRPLGNRGSRDDRGNLSEELE